MVAFFRDFFRSLGENAAWRRLELPALFRRIGDRMDAFDFPLLVVAEFERSGDLAAAWTAAVLQLPDLMLQEEKTALLAFLPVFESAKASVFAEKCALAAGQFDAFAKAARAERLRQTGLTLSLGFLGAALLLILLW